MVVALNALFGLIIIIAAVFCVLTIGQFVLMVFINLIYDITKRGKG